MTTPREQRINYGVRAILTRSRVCALKRLANQTAQAWERGLDLTVRENARIDRGQFAPPQPPPRKIIIIIRNARTWHVHRLMRQMLMLLRP